MMYLLKHKSLAVLFGGLLVFSACVKDSDPTPVAEPFDFAAAKPGDTLTIKGQNFDATASGNIVKFGDMQQATVVSASKTELKIVVPSFAAAKVFTVTLTANGKTTTVGTITIAPTTYYAIKGNFAAGSEYQLVTVSNGFGEELVVSLGKERINDLVYTPVTNEIMGVNDLGSKLVKINVTTKKVTSVALSSSATSGTAQLVLDKNYNLYAIKYDFTAAMQLQSLVKVDPVTGTSTVIKTFESNDDWYGPVYLPATNEIVGLKNEGKSLFMVNLTTKDTATVNLPGAVVTMYRALIVDNKSNLYAYKAYLHGDPTDAAKLVKVSAVTGQETVLKNLPVEGKFHDKVIYVSNGGGSFGDLFIGLWNQHGLFGILADLSGYMPYVFTTPIDNTYSELTTN